MCSIGIASACAAGGRLLIALIWTLMNSKRGENTLLAVAKQSSDKVNQKTASALVTKNLPTNGGRGVSHARATGCATRVAANEESC